MKCLIKQTCCTIIFNSQNNIGHLKNNPQCLNYNAQISLTKIILFHSRPADFYLFIKASWSLFIYKAFATQYSLLLIRFYTPIPAVCIGSDSNTAVAASHVPPPLSVHAALCVNTGQTCTQILNTSPCICNRVVSVHGIAAEIPVSRLTASLTGKSIGMFGQIKLILFEKINRIDTSTSWIFVMTGWTHASESRMKKHYRLVL